MVCGRREKAIAVGFGNFVACFARARLRSRPPIAKTGILAGDLSPQQLFEKR